MAQKRTNSNRSQKLHQQAMQAAQDGSFVIAFQLEALAAEACPMDLEPSRSVLYRSAASLALKCGQRRTAERHAALGLAGLNVPDEIAAELRQIIFDAAPK